MSEDDEFKILEQKMRQAERASNERAAYHAFQMWAHKEMLEGTSIKNAFMTGFLMAGRHYRKQRDTK